MLVKRLEENPILKPLSSHPWEAQAVFNGCPVKKGEEIYLLYRALSFPHPYSTHKEFIPASCVGIASSSNGVNFHDRRQFVVPEKGWEAAGCEDPRVTHLDGRFFVFYTAIARYPPGPEDIKIGVAVSSDLKRVEEKHLVTPFNSKAMALFPERIGNKIWSVLTAHTDSPPASVCVALFDRVEEMWDEAYWGAWHKDLGRHSLALVRNPEDQVEVGAPPIKTEFGWLLLFSYIRGYFTQNKLFTVEAALLDLKDPSKVIAQTRFPLLVPEEYYERVGYVPNIVFPSGALRKGNQLHLYYGGADTTCCVALLDINRLLRSLLKGSETKFVRGGENPIITPRQGWEAKATFNPAAVRVGGKVHILYRAMSQDDTSVLGYAQSGDGTRVDFRSPEPVYLPREDFEQKKQPGSSGCEDPRLTVMGDRTYMCYTAYDSRGPPRVALTSIRTGDMLGSKWDWEKPVLISPPEIDDKDACIFPERLEDPTNGQCRFLVFHRIANSIDYALVPSLEFDGKTWIEAHQWATPRKGSWDSEKIGIAAPPIKTSKGWILLYHGVDEKAVYRIGAMLLSLENPLEIIGRTDEPVFEPEEEYEKKGVVNNVVFPCGTVEIGDKIYMYYGGADRVTGVAAIETEKLLRSLLSE